MLMDTFFVLIFVFLVFAIGKIYYYKIIAGL